MNASEVIRIGRKRKRQASTTAVTMACPSCSNWRATSTMRMAFFAAKPTSTMKPIWVRMLISRPIRRTPPAAANRHIGTINRMARGRLQLPYCAANTRYTNTTHSGKTRRPMLPAVVCW
ncbi:hypothetical protein D9M71_770590 [compost metagenome]